MPILSDNPDVVPAQPETLVPARPPVAYPVVWIVRLLVEQYDPNGPIGATVWYKKARQVLDAQGGHVRYELSPASPVAEWAIASVESEAAVYPALAQALGTSIAALINAAKDRGIA